jgi:hypothetical protein
MQRNREGEAMKTKVWANGLGCDVTHGAMRLEVWEHGGVAVCKRDESACGFYRTEHAKIAPRNGRQWADVAAEAVAYRLNNRKDWTPCE